MSPEYIYKIVTPIDGAATITMVNVNSAVIRVIEENNPLYELVLELIDSDDMEQAFETMDVREYVHATTRSISENIRVGEYGEVFYDNQPLPEGIAATIMNAVSHGSTEGIEAVATFTERVLKSSTNTSKTALFSWIKDREFSVTSDGCFIAYKGVMQDEYGTPVSITAGPGYVNGERTEGHLDNTPGNHLSIERSYVEQEPGVSCGPGLHAGTYSYAKGFSRGVVLAVKIKPEDVVSVPNDSDAQKLRVSSYVVLNEVEDEFDDVLF